MISLPGFNNANGHVAAIYVSAGTHIDVPLTLIDDMTITIPPAGTAAGTHGWFSDPLRKPAPALSTVEIFFLTR
jgi:hypothetical protein